MRTPPRIVVIAPFVPKRHVDNAGQRYLGELARVLPDSAVFIVPRDTRSSRDAAAVGDPRVLLIDVLTPPAPESRFGTAYRFARDRVVPVRARDGFWEGLLENPTAQDAIARAEIIDLQWPEFVSLARQMRRVAPEVRIIATMHDVPSQGKIREFRAARSPRGFVRLALAAEQARRLESSVASVADLVVVFSEKDRVLLPSQAHATVVHPPATSAWALAHGHTSGFVPDETGSPADAANTTGDHRVLSIGPLLRPENCDGLEWFGREVFPLVQATIPDASLIHAGIYDDNQVKRLAGVPVELLGFVPDLEALQRDASVTIVPIRFGAGVKFKVLDALHDGLPLVSTSVGTEGIGDGNFQPESFDTAREFADAVIEVLTRPIAAVQRADAASGWARDRYGWPQFERSVRATYGLLGVEIAPEPEASVGTKPIASVVIPVRNGEAGLPSALAALARQPEAGQLEIVISDNGSTDRTREVALAWEGAFHGMQIVDSSRRAGINHARNAGLLAARTDKVLFCDHDDEARLGWTANLIDALDRADAAGGLAVSHVLSGFERALEPEFETEALHSALGYLPYAAGGSMGVRRHAALAVGGFDESFVKGHDEVEFCWRFQRAGYSLVGVDAAVLDYRQRGRAIDAGRQRFHSARTQIQLWCRYQDVAPLRPVSFRGAARGAALSVLQVPSLGPRQRRFPTARRIGWSLGTFAGHLKYRVLGDAPPALLLPTTAATGGDLTSAAGPSAQRRLRIGLLTPWDIDDERSWSGMILRMRDELAQVADVVPMSTAGVRTSVVDRAIARVLGRTSGKSYLWDFGLATAKRRGDAAREQIREADVDVVLAVVASTDVAFLRPGAVPVVQVVDTTFSAVRDFYPQFTSLHPLSSWQARIITTRAERATTRFLASTQWAVDALIEDGVPAADCVVAPPGPATVPPHDWRRPIRRDGDELRVLLVASDWQRKGGDVALEAVELLRQRGTDATLTVVGDAPPLPGWATPLGRLARSQLSEQYGTADVLIELASANAAGVTLTDAAAHGLPAVATNVGGVATIVAHGISGVLIEPGDGLVQRVADALVLLVDPDRRAAMSTASEEHYAQHLHWQHWTHSAMRACESALADSNGIPR